MSTSEEGALRRIMVVSRYWVKKGSMLQFSARAGTIQRRARFSGGNGGVTELLLSNVGQEDFRPRAAAGDSCPQIGVLRRCEGAEKLSGKKRKNYLLTECKTLIIADIARLVLEIDTRADVVAEC